MSDPDKDGKILDAVFAWLDSTVGCKLRVKQKSAFMWALYVVGFMWVWNRKFMTDYTTTIFGRIYLPEGYVMKEPGDAWRTLCHEGRHRFDANEHGEFWFSFSYLLPQALLLPLALGLGLWLLPWWGTLLLSVVALLPWPAHFRARWERNGYLASMIVDLSRNWVLEQPWYVDYMVSTYAGWGYYHMTLRRVVAETRVREDIARARRLVAGTEVDPYYTRMLAVLRTAGVSA